MIQDAVGLLEKEELLLREFFRAKKTAVTGASGYLGRALCERLTAFDCEVRAISRNPLPLTQERIRPCRTDLSAPESLEEFLGEVDIVFHLAAQTSARKAGENPSLDYRINVEPLIRIVEAFKKSGRVPVIIFAGTVTQAGLPRSLPVDETHPDNPLTVYDLHKKIAEDYLKFVTRKGWVKGVSLRLSNIYGPGAKEKASDRGVLNRMIRNALRGDPLTLLGEGSYVRDFLFIDDAVRAFLNAAVFAPQLLGQHFVIGSGRGHTLTDCFAMLREEAFSLTGKAPEIRALMPETGSELIETRNFVANSEKFSRITGWTPKVELREGMIRSLREAR